LDPLYPHPQLGKATVSPAPSLLIAYLYLLRITEPFMPQTNAERQRTWRERHRGEPRGNKCFLFYSK